jgi:hypothetical protein
MSETALAPMTGPRGVALRDTGDIERFATLVYKSTLVPPEHRNNLANVFGIIAYGLELGLNPMQSLQNIAFVSSKPSVYGDMLLGLVEASGLLEEFEEVEPGEAVSTGIGRCTLKRRGRPPITRTFTREMAETAKLWGKNTWATYPGRMLQMRARSWALRDAFSDVLKGLYAREEAEDIVLSMDAKGTYQLAPTPLKTREVLGTVEPQASDDAELRREVIRAMTSLLQHHFPHEHEDAYVKFIPHNAMAALRGSCGVEKWSELKAKSVEELREGYADLYKTLEPQEVAEDHMIGEEDDVPMHIPTEPHVQSSPAAAGMVVSDPSSSTSGQSSEPETTVDDPSADDVDESAGGIAHADRHESPTEQASTAPESSVATGDTITEPLDGFPDVELDDEGKVTQPGIELLVKRAQQYGTMPTWRKLRGEEPITLGRYHYCWVQVGKK